jgi:hypothetical protein
MQVTTQLTYVNKTAYERKQNIFVMYYEHQKNNLKNKYKYTNINKTVNKHIKKIYFYHQKQQNTSQQSSEDVYINKLIF